MFRYLASKFLRSIFVMQFLIYFCIGVSHAAAKQKTLNQQVINIAYLAQQQVPTPALLLIDSLLKEQGVLGAELAIIDNNTTGKFTGQQFNLKKIIVPVETNLLDVFKSSVLGQFEFVIADLPAEQVKQIADMAATKALLFDVQTTDDAQRNADCRHNVLHILPSRAMRADALAQYMMKKRWTKWFLLIGKNPEDSLYADAIKRSAKRLNIKLVAEKKWQHNFDSRGTEEAEIPVFTQVDDYDVLVIADEQGQIGDSLEYRTWKPRPVIGTQGLVATAWHPTHEQWGAIQIQNRFREKAGRWMNERDYAAYLAVRAIGEAATRVKSNSISAISAFILSDQFSLQGYKGSPLSFRKWDGQLRQPILLAAPRSLVAVAPIDGFLHPKTELDSLGYDQPESTCQ